MLTSFVYWLACNRVQLNKADALLRMRQGRNPALRARGGELLRELSECGINTSTIIVLRAISAAHAKAKAKEDAKLRAQLLPPVGAAAAPVRRASHSSSQNLVAVVKSALLPHLGHDHAHEHNETSLRRPSRRHSHRGGRLSTAMSHLLPHPLHRQAQRHSSHDVSSTHSTADVGEELPGSVSSQS